jgi:sugar lactone lactonase YvrE
MANQMMERALIFAGYEVNHVWGEGGHSGQHGSAIFPDAMRWLWKGWPEPVKPGVSKNAMLNEILIPGESWARVDSTAKLEGFPLPDSGERIVAHASAIGPKGAIFRANGKELTVSQAGRKPRRAASISSAARVVVGSNGNAYVTGADKVWLVLPNGTKKEVDSGLGRGRAITLSSDQTLLYVADSASHWIYSYQIQPDGTLKHKQRYYWLHTPDASTDSGANSMCVDSDGRLYVATRLGIQVCDQAGRVNCILPVPGGYVTAISFGGINSTTLYARNGNDLYSRKLKSRSAPAWATPIKPAPPRL